MATTILHEYLVKLGWDVDEPHFRDFQNKLAAVSTKFQELGKIAVVAGLAISTALIEVSDQMTDLYYAAQRAGTSVANLMAIRFAGSQIGVGADKIAGMVEGLASTIRSNPAMTVFFRELGAAVSPDSTQNFINLIGALKRLDLRGPFGHAFATQIAGQFGISEPDLVQLEANLPELIKQFNAAKSQETATGGVAFWNSPQWKKFTQDVGTLWNKIQLIGIAGLGKLLPDAERIVGFLNQMVDKFIVLDRLTHGWAGTIAAIGVAFGGVVASLKILGAVAGIFGIGGGAAAAGGAAAGAAGGAAAGGGFFAGVTGGALSALIPLVVAAVGAYLILHPTTATKIANATVTTTENLGKKLLDHFHTPAPTSYLGRAGTLASNIYSDLTQSQIGKDTIDALKALTSALSNLAVGVSAGIGGGSTLINDLLKNQGNFGRDAAALFGWTASASTRPNVNLQQTTTIHVTGSGSALDTGRAVANEQKILNGQMLRDMAGAVR